MAGKKTSLITGSNAKIRINDVTLAYAVDVQYQVDVATIPVETMGRYEVLSNEPISTTVAGSFTVVRYTSAAAKVNSSGGATSAISGAASTGNGVGNWGKKDGGETAATSNKGPSTHFNPKDILTSTTVDIEIYQKFVNSPGAPSATATDSLLIKKIKDARLTRMSGSINKRGILMESYQFVAEMAEDDSYESGSSGDTTDLT